VKGLILKKFKGGILNSVKPQTLYLVMSMGGDNPGAIARYAFTKRKISVLACPALLSK
jgi:hypothetical protein